MIEKSVVKNCMTCGIELVENKNIKKDWHRPLCNNCRDILLTYFTKKEEIERIIRFRAKFLAQGVRHE